MSEGRDQADAPPQCLPENGPLVSRTRLRRFFRLAERLLAIVGASFLLYHLCFELNVMTSESMAPTLQGDSYEAGDWILVEKVSRWWRSPRRGEIYLYYNADGDRVMKRIVGMPGETISIRDKRVHIDGTEWDQSKRERPIEYYAYGNLRSGQAVDCGEGYFMLGDDSTDSNDSRYTGVVPKEDFRGRAWAVIWPPSRVGTVR